MFPHVSRKSYPDRRNGQVSIPRRVGGVFPQSQPCEDCPECPDCRINTPKGRGRVSTWDIYPYGLPIWLYQYPEGSGACFHSKKPVVYLGYLVLVSIPRRVGGVFPLLPQRLLNRPQRLYQYPEGSSARFYWGNSRNPKIKGNIVSIPRRVERSFLLQDIAHFTTLFHFYPHILPFFRLRASQKNKFRRRYSHFSFSQPPYLAFSNAPTPIYRGSKAEICEHLKNMILPPRCSQNISL